MKLHPAWLPALALCPLASALSSTSNNAPASPLETVVVTANRSAPTSLPTHIPATLESITGAAVEKAINATDSEDAIKYFPSLLVRKRYPGDYNHAVLSSRASGTGNSARSAVYADGMLLSNYLGNGAAYAPRWMLVTPEEIACVDVMYGPFSAAYPGNSVGAIVDYATRMPEQLGAHAKVSYLVQPFSLYHTDATFSAHQQSASIGSREGNFSWWMNLNHTHSHGQPQTFITKTAGTTALQGNEVAVSGATLERDRKFAPWYILGTGTEYTTTQDHAKLKLAYELTPALRASYLLGYWQNESVGRPQSYLRDAQGNAIYSGAINVNGARYVLADTDFALTREQQKHFMHGMSLKSNGQKAWDFEVAMSMYDYATDELRSPITALPTAQTGGKGTLTDQHGTGWNTASLTATWRPSYAQQAHVVDFGYAVNHYTLRIRKTDVNDWLNAAAGSPNFSVGGKTRTHAVYAQDAWHVAADWKAVLGARLEQWHAYAGYTDNPKNSPDPYHYNKRSNTHVSPKAALAYQANSDTAVKYSVGHAIRFPTVNELYGATSSGSVQTINDPDLKPEKSWTHELTLQRTLASGSLRLTGFYEVVRDSIYSQRVAVNNVIVTRVTNVKNIATPGIELVVNSDPMWLAGLSLSASATWVDSRIKANDGYVDQPGDTHGKYQPRVPKWRATALLNYQFTPAFTLAYGVRYSGRQYSTLNNSDANGFAYQAASKYLVMDLRARWQFLPQWSAALGIDNLNNYQYWNFHPYPQRSYSAELRWDL